MKTGCTKSKEHFKKMKLLFRKNCSSIYKGCDLSIEMLSYKLTEIKLPKLRYPMSLLKKNKYFQKPNPTQAIDLESRQFILQLF